MKNEQQIKERLRNFISNLYMVKEEDKLKDAKKYIQHAIRELSWVLDDKPLK